MPNVMFTTALAIDTLDTPRRRDASPFNWFCVKETPHAQLRKISYSISEENTKKFLKLLTKQCASPFYISPDSPSKTTAWELAVTDDTAYVTVLAYVALSREGANLPVEFDFKLKRHPPTPESQLNEYISRQTNRKTQDAMINSLSAETPIIDRIKIYTEHACYWLDLANAVIANKVYKKNHFPHSCHIAAYFLHQAIRFYQHALYADKETTFPDPTDKTAWAKPLGELLCEDTRVYLKQQLNDTWLQRYMGCLKELAPRDIEFHLDKLLAQEQTLFAKRLANMQAASSTVESDDDSNKAHSDASSPSCSKH